MRSNRRTLVIAATAGLIVAVISVLGGVWLARALDDEPDVDGSVLLDEPGIFQQPVDDVNGEVTGDRLPSAVLLDTVDTPVDLTESDGRPMVVNVWFANCPPCQRELVDFAEVHGEVGDDVRFVGVDPFDPVDTMLRFAEARGVEYELLRDVDRTFATELEIVAYPVTLFVDSDGVIVRQTGEIDADELRSAIDELFGP